MARQHREDGVRSERADGAAVLVCGRCARVLSGRYEENGVVDEAADRHAEDVHEGAGRTVVIPASTGLAEDEPEDLVAVAVRTQQALDDGEGGPLVAAPAEDPANA